MLLFSFHIRKVIALIFELKVCCLGQVSFYKYWNYTAKYFYDSNNFQAKYEAVSLLGVKGPESDADHSVPSNCNAYNT